MAEPLSYRGPAELPLTYGAAPGLGRTAERPGIAVVVSGAPVAVRVDRPLGMALLLGPALTRVTLALPDGTVLAGPVQAIADSADYFEIAAGAPASQEERYV